MKSEVGTDVYLQTVLKLKELSFIEKPVLYNRIHSNKSACHVKKQNKKTCKREWLH